MGLKSNQLLFLFLKLCNFSGQISRDFDPLTSKRFLHVETHENFMSHLSARVTEELETPAVFY